MWLSQGTPEASQKHHAEFYKFTVKWLGTETTSTLKIQREFGHRKVTVVLLRLANSNVSIEQAGLYHFHEFRCFLLRTTTPARACVAPDNGQFGIGSGFGLLVDDGPGMKRPQYSRTSLRAERGNPSDV